MKRSIKNPFCILTLRFAQTIKNSSLQIVSFCQKQPPYLSCSPLLHFKKTLHL